MTRHLLTALGTAVLATALVCGAPPAGAPLQRVATMSIARAAHTATPLASGQVLIVGGMAGQGESVASVELFDPATNALAELDPLAEPRIGHTATRLPDGRVLVAGGFAGEYSRSIEVFDPAAQRFRPAGTLVEARSGQTATLLPDGRVLFAGGVGTGWTFLATAEIYDPATGRSEPTGSMSGARESHTATLLLDGRVLIVGGHRGRRPNQQVQASAELYSPRTGRFEPAGTLATARHKHDAVRLEDGRVLVLGGADHTDRLHYASTEIWDPASGAFEPGPTMAHRRYKIAGTSVVLPGGDVLVTAGAEALERLDVATGRFRPVAGNLPAAYRFAAAAALPGGDVLVAGGYADDNRSTAGVWRIGRW